MCGCVRVCVCVRVRVRGQVDVRSFRLQQSADAQVARCGAVAAAAALLRPLRRCCGRCGAVAVTAAATLRHVCGAVAAAVRRSGEGGGWAALVMPHCRRAPRRRAPRRCCRCRCRTRRCVCRLHAAAVAPRLCACACARACACACAFVCVSVCCVWERISPLVSCAHARACACESLWSATARNSPHRHRSSATARAAIFPLSLLPCPALVWARKTRSCPD